MEKNREQVAASAARQRLHQLIDFIDDPYLPALSEHLHALWYAAFRSWMLKRPKHSDVPFTTDPADWSGLEGSFDPAVTRWRLVYLMKVNELAPAAIVALRDEVLPYLSGDEGVLLQSWSSRAREALESWCLNSGFEDAWAREEAARTLVLWKRHGVEDPPTLELSFAKHLQEQALSYAAVDLQAPPPIVPLSGWNLAQHWSSYRTEALQLVSEWLDKYRKCCEGEFGDAHGRQRASRKRKRRREHAKLEQPYSGHEVNVTKLPGNQDNTRHFEWLVLWQVARWNMTQIAHEYGLGTVKPRPDSTGHYRTRATARHTIKTGIQDAAGRIGITVRKGQPGAPRKDRK